MYDAAVEAGLAPDLIIGTSGGSIAALIISTYPDRLERNKFIASSRLHEMLLSIQIEHPRVLLESGRALRWRIRGIGLAPTRRTYSRDPSLRSQGILASPNRITLLK